MTLTVTARGQVTFRKEVMQHLGIKPGDRIDVDLLPGHQAKLRVARRSGTIRDVYGMLAKETTKVATLEEIKQAIADGWAGKRGRSPSTRTCLSASSFKMMRDKAGWH